MLKKDNFNRLDAITEHTPIYFLDVIHVRIREEGICFYVEKVRNHLKLRNRVLDGMERNKSQ